MRAGADVDSDVVFVSPAEVSNALHKILQPIKEWTESELDMELNASDINVVEWVTQRRRL